MKRITVIAFLSILSITLFSQGIEDIEHICQSAAEAAQIDDFPTALKYYDTAIAIITQSERTDLVSNIGDDLMHYVISGLSKDNLSKARKYAQTLLDLRLSLMELYYKNDYFETKEDYVKYMSAEYQRMGYFLESINIIDLAGKCFGLGSDVFEIDHFINSEYLIARDNLAGYYSDYANNPRQSLAILYPTFLLSAELYGKDADMSVQLFSHLLLVYIFHLRSYALLDDPGMYNQVKQLSLPFPDYETSLGLIMDWKEIKKKTTEQFGEGLINKCRELLQLDPFGDPTVIVGSDECDALFNTLIDIHYGKLDVYEEDLDKLLLATTRPEDTLTYSFLVIQALENNQLNNLAFELFEKQRILFSKENRYDLIGTVDASYSTLAIRLGNYDLAQKVLAAYDLEESTEQIEQKTYISLLSILAHLYSGRDRNYQKANDLTMLAINAAENGDIYDSEDGYFNLFQLSALYNDLATYYYASGYLEDAINFCKKSIRLNKNRAARLGVLQLKNDNVLWPATQYTNLADYYIESGDLSTAKEILLECLGYYNNIEPGSPKLFNVYADLVYLSTLSGDLEGQRQYIESSYSLRMDLFTSGAQTMTKSQRIDYWFGLRGMDLEIISDLARNNNQISALAYDAALSQKGLLLMIEKHIKQCLENCDDAELKGAYNAFTNKAKEDSSHELENRLMFLYSHHPEYITSFTFPSWRDVQSKLKKGDVAIEFAKACSDGENVHYVALVLNPNMDQPQVVDLGVEALFERTLALGSKAYVENEQLYSLVWEKLDPFLKGVHDIYFSPDGALSQINIEVLQDKRGTSMNKRYNIYRLSSTRNLLDSSGAHQKQSAVLFGGLNYDTSTDEMVSVSRSLPSRVYSSSSYDGPIPSTRKGWSYLPGTYSEVTKISDILDVKHINNQVITGMNGTEEVFKNVCLDTPSILHIATHGFYFSEKEASRNKPSLLSHNENDSHTYPLKRCGLIFSGGQHAWLGENIPDGIDDGIISGEEIANIDLSETDLVVLSACQTGLGDQGADGVYGLQRAFKIAGANSIIMSLWEVNDEATELMMTQFYSSLFSGKSKRDSFEVAVSATRKRFDNPEYWAAFILLD